MCECNYMLTLYLYTIDAVTAYVEYNSGKILLDLEEFETAQSHFKSSFESRKKTFGVKDKRTMKTHLGVVQAARLAGNIQDAEEILKTAEDSLLGK